MVRRRRLYLFFLLLSCDACVRSENAFTCSFFFFFFPLMMLRSVWVSIRHDLVSIHGSGQWDLAATLCARSLLQQSVDGQFARYARYVLNACVRGRVNDEHALLPATVICLTFEPPQCPTPTPLTPVPPAIITRLLLPFAQRVQPVDSTIWVPQIPPPVQDRALLGTVSPFHPLPAVEFLQSG